MMSKDISFKNSSVRKVVGGVKKYGR